MSISGLPFLYKGEGSGPVSVQEAERSFRSCNIRPVVGDFSMICKEWGNENSSVGSLVIGGGHAPTISIVAMKPEHREIIRTGISKGKAYVGLCAGAIAAATEFQQDPRAKSEKSLYSLGLADVRAKGLCCFNNSYPGGATADPFETARAVDVQYGDSKGPVYWNLGPAFQFPKDSVGVVATYCLENGESPAAVVCNRYGSGAVVLSGVHPEIVTDQNAHTKIQGVVQQYPRLSEGVDGQKNLFQDICIRAGILSP